MTYHYLMDLALILLSTKVLGILTKRIQMPQVVGALVAGLILGPAMLNVLSETEFLTQLSELGVIVLMFSAGMGTDIQELKHSGKAGFLVALLGVIVPLVLGTGLAMFADRTGMIETSGFLEDVFIGTILTATSVSITVETLKEIGKLDTKVGNTILAAALIDDVLGLIALTIVSSLSGGQDSIALVLLKIVLFFVFSAVVSFLAHKFFCWLMALWPGRERRRYPVLAFVLCLLMAYCAEEFFGVADITGAYVAGLVISWHMAYSDIMDYLHGQKLRAVLEDDPEYFYEGRFTVNVWKSEKDWSRITIDYDVGPYKWSVLSSTDDWLWDPFNFQNGVIRPAVFKDIAVTTEVRAVKLAALLFGRAPVCPVFRVSSSDKRGVHIRFINPTLGLDETKLLPDGVIQFPEFVFFGDLGATLELWCDTGTGSVSVDFRQGRL